MKIILLIITILTFLPVSSSAQNDNLDTLKMILENGLQEIGDSVVLREFYLGNVVCRPYVKAFQEENEIVAEFMKKDSFQYEIEFHVDAQGSNQANLRLTQRRAYYIKKALYASGISTDRITAIGKGETEILNHCRNGVICSDAEHRQNRRMVIRIISK